MLAASVVMQQQLTKTSSSPMIIAAAIDIQAPARVDSTRSLQQQQHSTTSAAVNIGLVINHIIQ
jgi:hypothetical protein